MQSFLSHSMSWWEATYLRIGAVLLGLDRSIYHPAIVEFFSQLVVSFCWQSVFLWTHCIFPPLLAEFNTFLLVFSLPSFRAVVSWPNKPVAIFFFSHPQCTGQSCSATTCLQRPTGDSKTIHVYIFDKSTNCMLTGRKCRKGSPI